jgi:hypothetical protein
MTRAGFVRFLRFFVVAATAVTLVGGVSELSAGTMTILRSQ